MNGLKEVQLAALLHDIGKFAWRSGKAHHERYDKLTEEDYGRNGAHSKWSASYVRGMDMGRTIEDMVLFHHKPEQSKNRFFTKIIQKADHHSSKERIKDHIEKEVKKEPIISIFSKIKIPRENSGENNPTEHYLPMGLLTMEKIPTPRPTKEKVREGWHLQPEYKRLWKWFEEESRALKDCITFNTLLHLLKKYTIYMPSAAYTYEPDISLFDHSRTTAALATCLYHYTEGKETDFSDDRPYYLVVSGDFTGIQKFIYKISSPQEAQKGMSKRLRGRSFYINIINDAVSTLIIKRLNLTSANILFSGGGHFVLIAPNTKSVKDEIEKITEEVNRSFLQRYNAELYLAVSMNPCSGKELRDFGKILGEEIGFENLGKKKQKFSTLLDEVFKNEENIPQSLCPVCGNGKENDEKVCAECGRHETLGKNIANATYLVKAFSNQNEFFDVHEFGIGYKFLRASDPKKIIDEIKDLKIDAASIELLRINETDFADNSFIEFSNKSQNISLGFLFIGNTAPAYNKQRVLYFDHLAKISRGPNNLGILKMDVDDLGRIFSKGLGDNATISRVSTLSSYLDMFFLGYINKIAEGYYVLEHVCNDCEDRTYEITLTFINKNEKEETIKVHREKPDTKVCRNCLNRKNRIPTIYITYSGGDDLLVVGPYDDIIKFSKEFREKFKKWTCNNSDINLSAGISIVGAKFPIGKSTNIANSMLEASKDREKNRKLSMNNFMDTGKDRITVFNETVRWERSDSVPGFNDLLDFGMLMEKRVDKGDISKGLIYSLLTLWNSTFEDEKTLSDKMRKEKRKYVPLLKYKLARTVKDRDNGLMEELNKKLICNPGYMGWIKIPVSWVSLRTR